MDEFETPIATVDAALFTLRQDQLSVVLARRDKEPFAGQFALPGGFVHTDEDEDTEATARRVLKEKAGIAAPYLEQLFTFSGKHRDPRRWSISVAYFALVAESELSGGSFDLVPVDRLTRMPHLAFDHNRIVEAAVRRLRDKATYSPLPAYMLPPHFTLPELQKVYETVMGVKLSKATFRRKVEAQGIVTAVRGKVRHGSPIPAQLYRLADHLRDFVPGAAQMR
jgi:8-oxo-dGTP diphosphatase